MAESLRGTIVWGACSAGSGVYRSVDVLFLRIRFVLGLERLIDFTLSSPRAFLAARLAIQRRGDVPLDVASVEWSEEGRTADAARAIHKRS